MMNGGGGGGGSRPSGNNNGGATNEFVGHMYRSTTTTTTSCKSPEGSVDFPFTCAQWKELERQAMIYKYMISSLPVPSDLLFPSSTRFPPVDSSPSSLYNVRYSKAGDLEPGRCKRTDGKKWRCSKEVAPHQKYCERHLHRGRPRSRKPVEVKNNGDNHKKTRLHLPNSTDCQHFAEGNHKPLLHLNAETDLSISSSPSCRGTNRDLEDQMVAAVDASDQRLQNPIEANMGFSNEGSSMYGSSSFFHHQDYMEQHQLLGYPAPQIEPPVLFIDAWSIDNLNSSNTQNSESSHENHSPSLNLSIGSILDQEIISLKCSNEQSTRDSRCLSSVSWEPFARGGPLAEALQPHDSISIASPTRVLHRALFSHSDGSVCNSPTFVATTSEAAFQRYN